MYKELYESRTTHVKNLKQLVVEHIERLGGVVRMAAENGLTEVDSAVILDINSSLLSSLRQENARFEKEVNSILHPKGQSNEITSSRRTS